MECVELRDPIPGRVIPQLGKPAPKPCGLFLACDIVWVSINYLAADRMDVKYIYSLSCPESGEVRYIGKANNPEARLKSHLRDCYRRDYPVYRWIRKILSKGLLPVMTIISKHEGRDWIQAEVDAILRFRSAGARLLNVAKGGDQPECSPEQRARNGKKTADKIHGDPEARKVWLLKKRAADAIKWMEKNSPPERLERFKATLRHVAMMRPDVFGKWANI